MSSLYMLNVTIHVLAAMVWLGGMLFLAAVGAPVLRRIEPEELRARLFREIGVRFRWAGWVCIGVLVVTGILNLHFRGIVHEAVMGSPGFWGSPYGRSLAAKLAAVTAMIGISGIHDFVDGPRASRLAPGSPEALAYRRRAALLGRANALLGVVVVWVAVRLARGG